MVRCRPARLLGERTPGVVWVACAAQTVARSGSRLWIFAKPKTADSEAVVIWPSPMAMIIFSRPAFAGSTSLKDHTLPRGRRPLRAGGAVVLITSKNVGTKGSLWG